ncbi:MAG: nuclear transport factor 2 family protein [Burkholderiales bacterium]|nr:nuclear transport factor 2 family protein [Burkholderiales bacterium]
MQDGSASSTLETLRRLNARFIHNYVTNDVAGHDAILHPEFVCVNSNGSRTDRAAYLKRWATGFHPDVVTYWDVRDENITLIGDVALVRSTNKHTIHRDGRDTTGMTTYTDTYLRDDGRWLCIQAQLTPVVPGYEPGDDTIVSVYLRGVKQVRQS